MGSSDFIPYIRALREAVQPFADGLDEGELDAALLRLKGAVGDLSQLEDKVAALVDEPDEQDKVRKLVMALTLAEFSLSMDW
jgi:hypothetical protein